MVCRSNSVLKEAYPLLTICQILFSPLALLAPEFDLLALQGDGFLGLDGSASISMGLGD